MVNLSKGWRSRGINIGGGFNFSRTGGYNVQNNEQFRIFNTMYGINTNFRYDLKEVFNASLTSNFSFSKAVPNYRVL